MRSAPAAITRAFSFGQPCSGLTSRKRDSPKLAMARAAAPTFSPSCGSTRTTTGAGVSIQRLVLSVPAPGIAHHRIDRNSIMFAYCGAHLLGGLRGQRSETVSSPLCLSLAQAYPYIEARVDEDRKAHLALERAEDIVVEW